MTLATLRRNVGRIVQPLTRLWQRDSNRHMGDLFVDQRTAFENAVADESRAAEVHTFVAHTAEEFYRVFSPVDGLLRKRYSPDGFIFRGHGSRRHCLIPRIFRPGGQMPVGDYWTPTPA